MRTFRSWLKSGLRHSRLKTGTILIKTTWIDEYLEQFEATENIAKAIVDAALAEIKRGG